MKTKVSLTASHLFFISPKHWLSTICSLSALCSGVAESSLAFSVPPTPKPHSSSGSAGPVQSVPSPWACNPLSSWDSPNPYKRWTHLGPCQTQEMLPGALKVKRQELWGNLKQSLEERSISWNCQWDTNSRLLKKEYIVKMSKRRDIGSMLARGIIPETTKWWHWSPSHCWVK